jgi:hypothetical protein
MDKQFNITWCQSQNEIPKIGTTCSKCGTGELRQSKYYDGVYCSNKACGWSWRPSKFVKQQENKPLPLVQNDNTEVLKALREIWLKLAEMEKEFKSFTIIFSEKKADEELKG